MTKSAKIWAVVPAAGSGQRMLQDTPKQYLKLHGKTIIEHTLGVLLDYSNIERIAVCTAKDDMIWPTLDCTSEPSIIQVNGGITRAESVLNGLEALMSYASIGDWVVVHDAARPCVSIELIQRLADAVQGDDVGGILALAAKDTLKRATTDGEPRVAETLDRSTVWQAQTPQMFRLEILMDALKVALAKGLEITDEASAIEHAGYAPRLIEGDARNLKVTTPEDLVLAEFLLG